MKKALSTTQNPGSPEQSFDPAGQAAFRSGFVAIVGRPNAGKSTLLNWILGSVISIVTPKAQTTRERVLGILTESAGQMVFVDTPGIHRAREGGINAFMMNEAREATRDTSLIWYLVDPASELKHEQAVIDLLKGCDTPVILLASKQDLLGAARRARSEALLAAVEDGLVAAGVRVLGRALISATTGKGVAALLERSWAALPEGPRYYPDSEQLSDRPMRFFVAEKIREQLLLCLGDELPYSCAVAIEKYEEPVPTPGKRPMTRIEATIHVERESQKGMVIGKGGQKIREIGQAAREAIERFIGGDEGGAPSKVFLGLQVNVLKDWTRNREALKRMGYDLPPATPKKRSLP